jgi:hypothetical protein
MYLLFAGPQRELASIAVILAYFELTLLLGRYPYISTYITIFIQVLLKSISLICIFLPLIFAFAFGFDLIFYEINNARAPETLAISFFKTIMMMNGEIEYQNTNLEISSVLSRIIFILFFIFIVVVFSNVLNALAISDTQEIINTAKIISCRQEIELYSKLEHIWIAFFSSKNCSINFIKYFCNYCKHKLSFNLNACPKEFINQKSIFKLLSNPRTSYFSRKIHKYLFGYDFNEMTKKCIEIIESGKDYCYTQNNNDRYLYAGSSESSIYQDISENIPMYGNKNELDILEYNEEERRPEKDTSSYHKYIKYLFDENRSNLSSSLSTTEEEFSESLNKELAKSNSSIYKPSKYLVNDERSSLVDSNYQNSKNYGVTRNLQEILRPRPPRPPPHAPMRPLLPFPDPVEYCNLALPLSCGLQYETDSKIKDGQISNSKIDLRIQNALDEMSMKINTISIMTESKLNSLSQDLQDIKAILSSMQHK